MKCNLHFICNIILIILNNGTKQKYKFVIFLEIVCFTRHPQTDPSAVNFVCHPEQRPKSTRLESKFEPPPIFWTSESPPIFVQLKSKFSSSRKILQTSNFNYFRFKTANLNKNIIFVLEYFLKRRIFSYKSRLRIVRRN